VLITRIVPAAAGKTLAAAGLSFEMLGGDASPGRAELLARASGRRGVLASLSDKVDAEFLSAAGPSLCVVANFAVGFENIDLAACRAAGVVATNTPDVLTDATADLTWALILAAARRVGEGERMVRAGRWVGWAPTQMMGLELRGSTLGIVGAGRIGSAVARRAIGFGMKVIYVHPRAAVDLERDLAARRVELEECLSTADVVSLHIPMRPENRHLLDRRRLGLIRPSAILINTARGPLIDEAALVEILRERRIAAAGLDVYEFEPKLSPGLTELENVVLLPHLGSATQATRDRMAELAARNIVEVLAGRPAVTPLA